MPSNVMCLVQSCNHIISWTAGILFFAGWWLMIDVYSQYSSMIEENKVYHFPGFISTITGVVMNLIPFDAIRNNLFDEGRICGMPPMFAAKLILFFSLMFSFGTVIGSAYILVNDFMLDQSKHQWPGYAIFLQNCMIVSAMMMMRFGRRRDEYY